MIGMTLLVQSVNKEWNVLLLEIDRCDRCGARAWVRVTFQSGDVLLFCSHHGQEVVPALRDKHPDVLVYDNTDKLYEMEKAFQ